MPQLGVTSILGQQLIMGAALHDLARFQHDDLVGIGHGAQAVGDGDHGAPLARAVQRILNFVFRFTVQRRCRLVQQQDGRVFQQGARNADALLFPARQFQPALARQRCHILRADVR